jgi:hypothetical protein
MAEYPQQDAFVLGGGEVNYWMRATLLLGGYVSWYSPRVPDVSGALAPGGPGSLVPGTIVVTRSKKVVF